MFALLISAAVLLVLPAVYRSLVRTQRTLIGTFETLLATSNRQIQAGYGDPAQRDDITRRLRRLRRGLPVLRVLALDWIWPVK